MGNMKVHQINKCDFTVCGNNNNNINNNRPNNDNNNNNNNKNVPLFS